MQIEGTTGRLRGGPRDGRGQGGRNRGPEARRFGVPSWVQMARRDAEGGPRVSMQHAVVYWVAYRGQDMGRSRTVSEGGFFAVFGVISSQANNTGPGGGRRRSRERKSYPRGVYGECPATVRCDSHDSPGKRACLLAKAAYSRR
jgi:hypothetical protein